MPQVELNTSYEFSKVFSAADVETFAQLSQDTNPIHIDDTYAAQSVFKGRVVHGVLVLSMFSKIFGTIYPGEGGVYVSQNAKMLRPIMVGEKATAKVTLKEFNNRTRKGVFTAECFNEKGQVAIRGEAAVLFPEGYQMAE